MIFLTVPPLPSQSFSGGQPKSSSQQVTQRSRFIFSVTSAQFMACSASGVASSPAAAELAISLVAASEAGRGGSVGVAAGLMIATGISWREPFLLPFLPGFLLVLP